MTARESTAELLWKLPVVETTHRRFPCHRCGQDVGRNCWICDACIEPQRREDRARELKPARDSIDDDYRWACFGNPLLLTRIAGRPTQIAGAMALLSQGEKVVTIVGATGTGKTSLACAMLSSVIEAGVNLQCDGDTLRRAKRARFYHAYDLSVARGEHRLGGNEPPKITDAKTASVLVLDELGRDDRKTSDVAEVIRRRLAMGLPTIVTTWQTQSEIAAAYDGGIARRLYQRATLIRLGGT